MKNRCPEGHGCLGGDPCQEPHRKILTLLGLKVKFSKETGLPSQWGSETRKFGSKRVDSVMLPSKEDIG